MRLLGEDLALFRTRGGALGLIDARCPHRDASLAYGIADASAVRCPYHGWRFDISGSCVEVSTLADDAGLRGPWRDARAGRRHRGSRQGSGHRRRRVRRRGASC